MAVSSVRRAGPATAGARIEGGGIGREHYRTIARQLVAATAACPSWAHDNIAYGRRDATAEQVEDAARRANAHEFIDRLPHKYETTAGERGVKLSGGQQQRMAIARAVLASPQILILDEATSNLDTESEQLIQASMATLLAGRTTFVIAHRLSTIRRADLILLLEDGRIVERGTHQQLMSAGGTYFRMLHRQMAFSREGHQDAAFELDVAESSV
jgi:ABC-type multidrug transport system fused ATPase/permease subunit